MRALTVTLPAFAATLALGAGAAFANPITVPGGTYALDPTHTSVTWKVSHFGLSSYTARFETVSGTLDLNADDPTASTVSVTVDPASVSTGFPFPEQEDFDAKLANDAGWFNSGAHPEITFTSTSLELTGDSTGTMTGDLTMLGTTLPVTFDVTLNGQFDQHPILENHAAIGFSAVTTIDRTDFGFGTATPAIGAEVEVLVETEFTMPTGDS